MVPNHPGTGARHAGAFRSFARSWRQRPDVLLLLMAGAVPLSFATWMALLDNFAIHRVGFSGQEIGSKLHAPELAVAGRAVVPVAVDLELSLVQEAHVDGEPGVRCDLHHRVQALG